MTAKPLIAKLNLHLEAPDQAVRKRFTRAFRAAWGSIPERCRRAMSKRWAEKGPPVMRLTATPMPEEEGGCKVLGWVSFEGRNFGDGPSSVNFFALVVGILPNPLLEALIIHEFGHVYGDEEYGCLQTEEDVHRITDSWGWKVRMKELRQWSDSYYALIDLAVQQATAPVPAA